MRRSSATNPMPPPFLPLRSDLCVMIESGLVKRDGKHDVGWPTGACMNVFGCSGGTWEGQRGARMMVDRYFWMVGCQAVSCAGLRQR